MARYFIRSSGWVEDEAFLPDPGPLPSIIVSEHEAINTGLLTAGGDTIMRAPNPMGFIWERE